MQDLQSAMMWRYATKKFDVTKKLTAEEQESLVEAVRMAPTSFGLQPWKLLVVTNQEVRRHLQSAAFGQPQITDCSALFIFAAEKKLDENFVNTYIDRISEIRSVPVEVLSGFRDMMNASLASKNETERVEWAARQAYIGLGTLLTAAALQSIDVCPMEGFDPKQFDQILGLEEKGLETKVIAAVGYRDQTDPTIAYAKVRRPKEEMIITL